MLIRSTWTLKVSEPTVLPRSYNLELVKNLHNRLGLEIGKDEIPSVTYSSLLGICSASKDFLTFSPDQFYQLSICGLQAVSSKAIASLDLSAGLEFLGAKFEVCDRQDHITSYEELYTRLIANEPEPIHRFNLQFITPTAFAQGHNHLPLPLPSLMFRSWLERWNEFAPVYLGGDELISYLESGVAIKQHKIKTSLHQLQRGYTIGFTGQVTLQVLRYVEPLLANVAHLLVCYSQFASTGMKTRLGMGQTTVDEGIRECNG
ncbi:CRISPR system precrRNA processing endoribonuclease RAMP protein Cas6 [Planktothrix mougeotii]|uniref:CRISPR system precrRNA processing endoribonuclease RAMP protein Cas6 n=1 Tax=Planktothrix mougeotii LEGE 06226 TaxID=1828728 RepID=A0ABR9U683_9CYAN|nr:CRISPR system precrRNA processing endoribonuclease RAMP protein Cas6 [Planktothrix mougeotii]MBE9141967.1 CRISPR system precrRNA processing endoribonuclease RAMP protein Cas6 [Planktothrix mougeotii LEGE 06226]